MTTTSEKIEILSVIREHCQYCPEDLGAVAQALLAVEDKLDYSMRYSLEYLLQTYVIARAQMEPEGLQSILDRFPVPTSEGGIEEALDTAHDKLSQEVRSVSPTPDSISKFADLQESISNLSRSNKLALANDRESDNEDTGNGKKRAVKNKKVTPEEEKVSESKDKPKNKKNKMPDLKEGLVPTDLTGLENFRESSSVKSGISQDGSVWNVRLIVEGHTASGRYFPADVLREAIPLFEGARSYVNHPDENFQGGDRPTENLVGWFENVTLKEGDGLYADWHILAHSGKDYLREQLVELQEANKLDLIGLSLLGLGKNSFKQVDGKTVKYSEAITMVRSVDLVDVPGAGGKVLEAIRESDAQKIRSEIMSLETMTAEELKEANPTLYEDMLRMSLAAAEAAKSEGDSKPEPEPEPELKPDEKLRESGNVDKTSAKERVELLLDRMAIRDSNDLVTEKIKESNLPEPLRESLRKQFIGKVVDDKDVDEQISIYREAAAEMAPIGNKSFALPSQAYLIDETDKMQIAMDRLFELPIADEHSNIPRLSGIREAYVMMTGDYEFTWGAIPLDDRIREGAGSTPTAAKVVGGGTVTFANVLGVSINRRLLAQYRRQVMWWEPFTTITTLNNLKQQDRNRVESLGALSERTTGGAEYAELTWAEQLHQFTPTEYGNLVPIAQRAIVDDDLRALTRAADELGRSAGITLNEYVSNLFTQNSGDGPVFVDTGQDGVADAGTDNVFQGSTTTEHNNRITSNLNRASFKDADQRIRIMSDKSQKRIGLTPAHLLIPNELRETALQIQGSLLVPDSANNANNIFANTFTVIEVPQFTDVNNWYLMSGKDQLEMLEMGFLNGRREPELFVQSDPLMGMMFTHDVLNYKIRHRYGGGWLDYRGSVASIVA